MQSKRMRSRKRANEPWFIIKPLKKEEEREQ